MDVSNDQKEIKEIAFKIQFQSIELVAILQEHIDKELLNKDYNYRLSLIICYEVIKRLCCRGVILFNADKVGFNQEYFVGLVGDKLKENVTIKEYSHDKRDSLTLLDFGCFSENYYNKRCRDLEKAMVGSMIDHANKASESEDDPTITTAAIVASIINVYINIIEHSLLNNIFSIRKKFLKSNNIPKFLIDEINNQFNEEKTDRRLFIREV